MPPIKKHRLYLEGTKYRDLSSLVEEYAQYSGAEIKWTRMFYGCPRAIIKLPSKDSKKAYAEFTIIGPNLNIGKLEETTERDALKAAKRVFYHFRRFTIKESLTRKSI